MSLPNEMVPTTVRVAQWIARLPPKQKVAGSNPASDVFLSPKPSCEKESKKKRERQQEKKRKKEKGPKSDWSQWGLNP